jgi:hypothetical protein
MRLLFDEQLSDALPTLPADVSPGSLHVRILAGSGVDVVLAAHESGIRYPIIA